MSHYFIYKTTHVPTGKYYIGKHSTDNLDDGYLGSGVKLQNAVRKHGKSNFVREIIAQALDEMSLNELERLYVNDELINDPLSYNLALGGQGGCIVLKEGHPLYEPTKKKIQTARIRDRALYSSMMKERHARKDPSIHGLPRDTETRKKISEAHKGKPKPWLVGRKHSEESITKMRKPRGPKNMSDEAKAQLKALHTTLVKCEHCGKETNTSNHKRWHGDKCKHKGSHV